MRLSPIWSGCGWCWPFKLGRGWSETFPFCVARLGQLILPPGRCVRRFSWVGPAHLGHRRFCLSAYSFAFLISSHLFLYINLSWLQGEAARLVCTIMPVVHVQGIHSVGACANAGIAETAHTDVSHGITATIHLKFVFFSDAVAWGCRLGCWSGRCPPHAKSATSERV